MAAIANLVVNLVGWAELNSMRNGLRLRVPWWCSHVTLRLHVRPIDQIVLCPSFQVPGWTPVLHMPWCLPATEVSGQAHHSSRGLLPGQGSIACPLVTRRCTHPSQTLIHHVQEPVSVTVILVIQPTGTAAFAPSLSFTAQLLIYYILEANILLPPITFNINDIFLYIK